MPRYKQPGKWSDLIKALEKKGHRIPNKNDIWGVRKLRNRIEHEGGSAGREDAERAIETVEAFIERVVDKMEMPPRVEVPRKKPRKPKKRAFEPEHARPRREREVRVPHPVPNIYVRRELPPVVPWVATFIFLSPIFSWVLTSTYGLGWLGTFRLETAAGVPLALALAALVACLPQYKFRSAVSIFLSAIFSRYLLSWNFLQYYAPIWLQMGAALIAVLFAFVLVFGFAEEFFGELID